MNSKFGQINYKEALKGLLVTVISAVAVHLLSVLNSGDITAINWVVVGTTALSTALGYIVTFLSSNSEGTPLETEAAVNKK